ncbi:MAG TPA: maleylpyruvate isomerase N-terminal domain-containing protein [Acidimicrobiales bacterium]
MDRDSYLASLAADTDLLLATAGGALDLPVPTCPGWTCERLVGHMGRVHRWTAAWVTTGSAQQVEPAPAGPAVVEWARAGRDELVAALAAADPDGHVDTWAGPQPTVFWPRRMAIEAALHRFDAQSTVGDTTPIGTDLALDGIDEMFAVVLPWRGTAELEGTGETIHLHATDPDLAAAAGSAGGEWLVTLGAEGVSVEHAHAKGDVAVRGSASDLLLLLWNRVGADRFQVFGDATLLDRWRTAVTV